jgi:serine/threonine-protein kinase
MSPEQLQGSAEVDPRSDIWALGVVLFELVSGGRPFDGENAAAIGARIAAGSPKALRDVVDGVPPGLEAVVVRCLEKDPAKRPQDIAELARALVRFVPEEKRGSLDAIARTLGSATQDTAARASTGKRATKFREWPRRVVGFAVAAVITLLAVALARRDHAASIVAAPAATTPAAPAVSAAPTTDASVPPRSEPVASSAAPSATSPPRAPLKKPAPAPTSTKPAIAAKPPAPSAKSPAHDVDLSDPALGGR